VALVHLFAFSRVAPVHRFALLPLAARGFPLVDLDLLTAFPAPISAEGATGP
jgi:hypothetical protein